MITDRSVVRSWGRGRNKILTEIEATGPLFVSMIEMTRNFSFSEQFECFAMPRLLKRWRIVNTVPHPITGRNPSSYLCMHQYYGFHRPTKQNKEPHGSNHFDERKPESDTRAAEADLKSAFSAFSRRLWPSKSISQFSGFIAFVLIKLRWTATIAVIHTAATIYNLHRFPKFTFRVKNVDKRKWTP